MKLFAIALAMFGVTQLTACGGGMRLYGPKSCEGESDGQTTLAAYPTANGEAATCLPKDKVAFLLCVRELGLSSDTRDVTTKGGADLTVTDAGKAGFTAEQTNKLVQLWESQGVLAGARADMVRACINMLPPDQRPQTKCGDEFPKPAPPPAPTQAPVPAATP